MKIKVSAFIFVLLYTVYCSPADSNDFDMGSDYEMQNDNDNYGGNYEDTEDNVEESKMPDRPLEINTGPEKFYKDLGESVVLPCVITGSNYVQVWRKKDAVLFQAGIKMAATPNMKLFENGSLEISNLQPQDDGEYECLAMDTEKNSPKVQHEVILRVPPEIEFLVAKNNITLLKNGDTLILTCRARGYPKPIISWHKGPSRFDVQGEVLEIPNIKHHAAGTYKCLADNKIGEPAFSYINIKVEFKPVITIEKISVSSENNSETELECLVHSEPRSQVVWIKDGHTIVNSDRVQLISNEHKHNLVLKDIKDSDFGVYVCSATNPLGTSRKNINLVQTPAVHNFMKSQNEAKVFLTWQVQSKSDLSGNELSYTKKGVNEWKTPNSEVKLDVNPVGNDVYEVKYTFSKGLDPGEYELKFRTQNAKGWTEFSDTMTVDERQVTTTSTLPSVSDVPAEHQESGNQSGFVKESPSTVTESSDSSSITPRIKELISIAFLTWSLTRLAATRI